MMFSLAQKDNAISLSIFRAYLTAILSMFGKTVFTGIHGIARECISNDPIGAKVTFDFINLTNFDSHEMMIFN